MLHFFLHLYGVTFFGTPNNDQDDGQDHGDDYDGDYEEEEEEVDSKEGSDDL